MKKIALIFLALIWLCGLAILIVALTDVYPDNVFVNYRMAVVMSFFTLSGLIRQTYKRMISDE
jgi:hypothetical protein